MDTLKELRDFWEQSGKVICCVTKQDICVYKTVYVIVKFCGYKGLYPDEYHLHRYFEIGEKWYVSVDMKNESLFPLLAKITEEFSELTPK